MFYNFLSIYMIIGAVVASRLSDIEDWNVLFLEAGGDRSIIYDFPVTAANLKLIAIYWKYKTEPGTKYCRGDSYLMILAYA